MNTKLLAICLPAFVLLLIAPNSGDPLLVIASAGVLALIFALWSKGGLSILVVPLLLQWMSVATKPIQSALLGVKLNDLSEFGYDITAGVWFGLAGVAALAIGLRLGSKGIDAKYVGHLKSKIQTVPVRVILMISIGTIVAGHLFQAIQFQVGPLREIVSQVANIQYAGLFLLVYWSSIARKYQILVAVIAAAEIAMGLTGYFSEFKFVFITLIAAIIIADPVLKIRNFLFGTIVAVCAFCASVFWTAIKPEYRIFLNAGTGQQVAVVNQGERLSFLYERAATISSEDFNNGVADLFSRLSYIDFLARTTQRVPAAVPHELGGRSFGAIRHVLVPRLIYPSKPPLEHDTYVTTRYTGIHFLLATQTSVSIGYLGELYIDFGYVGALIAVLSIGLLVGWQFRFILRQKGPLIINLPLAFLMITPILLFERALVKTFAPIILVFVLVLVLQKWVAPWFLRTFLNKSLRARIA